MFKVYKNTTRCYSEDVIKPEGKYTYICPNCKKQYKRHKKPTKQAACKNCCNKYNNKDWDKKFVLKRLII